MAEYPNLAPWSLEELLMLHEAAAATGAARALGSELRSVADMKASLQRRDEKLHEALNAVDASGGIGSILSNNTCRVNELKDLAKWKERFASLQVSANGAKFSTADYKADLQNIGLSNVGGSLFSVEPEAEAPELVVRLKGLEATLYYMPLLDDSSSEDEDEGEEDEGRRSKALTDNTAVAQTWGAAMLKCNPGQELQTAQTELSVKVVCALQMSVLTGEKGEQDQAAKRRRVGAPS